MTDFFLQAFNAVSDQDFEERPVTPEEFVEGEEWLNYPPLSQYQYMIMRATSQIYKYDTLVALYGEEKAKERWKETFTEIILQLGKGAGKDWTSSIAMVYIIYLLLCLKDPAKYYNMPEDTHIDLINIAINADQAKNIFFKYVKQHLKRLEWFIGRYKQPIGPNSIEFDKSVTLYSGHSEREAFEGLNLFYAVLDEISGFALESKTGNDLANTAQATYDMYRDSVDSRFPNFGKVSLLSFPRFKDDFIQQKYNEAIAEKQVVIRSHTFKLKEDLPDGTEGNEFTIEWEEDHILEYRLPGIFCLRRPSWEVKPTVTIEDYKMNFYRNVGNALGKFACMPSNLEDGYFKNHAAVDEAFKKNNGVDEDGVFLRSFVPDKTKKYYVHVDLAQKHDHCAVALAHVEKWVNVDEGNPHGEPYPYIVVDAVRWWTPTAEKSVDFKDVRNYIVSLKRRGFNIELVTFDRWNSHDTMNYLSEEHGMDTALLSVALPHYQDLQTVMYDYRLEGPNIELLREELKQLRIVKNKIDHPSKGSKDLSDAVCGAVFNAVDNAEKPSDIEVEVLTYRDVRARMDDEPRPSGIINPPKSSKPMPSDMAQFLAGLRVL